MSRHVSSERKFAYYLGSALVGVGLLLFLSVFVTGAMNFGNFEGFNGQVQNSAFRGIGGMILMMVGGFVRNVGARGAAGSGLILDPERARRDLEPFSRQGGGMLKDALDEADVSLGSRRDDEPTVMIRCRACSTLNEENSKFCQECGQPV